MKRITVAALVAFTAVGLVYAGGSKEEPKKETPKAETKAPAPAGKLSMGGSTTVEPIITRAIESFSKVNPSAKLSYDSQGSSVGITGVIDGVYDLGGSSREIKKEEIDKGVKPIAICLDGLAVIVNGGIPVDNLEVRQIADLFNGTVKNWKELGGPDAPVVVVNRDEASGTRAAFLELVLQAVYKQKNDPKQKFLKDAITVESNGDMVTKVGSTPNAIGYCGFGYLEQARKMGAKSISVNGIKDDVKNIYNKTYPISRELFMVSKGDLPAGSLKKSFVDYLLSAEGQAIVAKAGFIPFEK